jgi:hypothetical protein
MNNVFSVLTLFFICLWGSPLAAQQLVYANTLFVAVIAQTTSYQSEIHIHNSGTSPTQVQLLYHGAVGSATAGTMSCPVVNIPAGEVLQTSLGAACPSLNPGSNFGALEVACCAFNNVAIYTRVQSPTGNGFSIEGMIDTFYSGSAVREVIGLKRQVAAPGYQSNCFLWNRENRAGRVVVTLAQGNGTFLADEIIDLPANAVLRLLDVFATLGLPAGDYVNARVNFQSIAPIQGGGPVLHMAACTVQNNTSFDADFRVAKWRN